MGIGTAKGEDSVQQALNNAIKSPLLDEISLSGAQGIMIHLTVSPNVSLFSINNTMANIHDTIDGDAYVIFGTTTDKTLANDEVKITIVATGFQETTKDTNNTPSTPISNTEKQTTSTAQQNNDKNYYDTPPSMRGYSIKHTLE